MTRELVARVPSSRDPAVVYQVFLEGPRYQCTCPGFGFRSNCRHVKVLAELRALPARRPNCAHCGDDTPMEWDPVSGRWACPSCSRTS